MNRLISLCGISLLVHLLLLPALAQEHEKAEEALDAAKNAFGPSPSASSTASFNNQDDAAALLVTKLLDERLSTFSKSLQEQLRREMDDVLAQQRETLEKEIIQTSFLSKTGASKHELELLEARLRDAYAEDMGGMELWMRQEYGHSLSELKQQHAAALVELEERMRLQHETDLAILKAEILQALDEHKETVQRLDERMRQQVVVDQQSPALLETRRPSLRSSPQTISTTSTTSIPTTASFQAELDTVKTNLQSLQDRLACIGPKSNADDIYFSGCNVLIRNGSGRTDNTNARGNLIVGYNEGAVRQSGSHNVILGNQNDYTSYGGLVTGQGKHLMTAFETIVQTDD